MSQAIAIKLGKKIQKINVLDSTTVERELESMRSKREMAEAQKQQLREEQEAVLEEQKAAIESMKEREKQLTEVADALNNQISEMQKAYQSSISKYRNQIAELSVAIAKRILLKEIQNDNYDITTIITKSLEKVPSEQEVTVYLSSEDFGLCQELIESNPDHSLKKLKIHPDNSVGKAECRVETPKGVIEHFIDEHLKEISNAFGLVD